MNHSLVERASRVIRQFMEEFDYVDGRSLWVLFEDVFPDFLVALDFSVEKFFQVGYTWEEEAGTATFDSPDSWTPVRQEWVPDQRNRYLARNLQHAGAKLDDFLRLLGDEAEPLALRALREGAPQERRLPLPVEPLNLQDPDTARNLGCVLAGGRPLAVRAFQTEYREAADGNTSTFAINTGEVDRLGTIILPRGMLVEEYRENPLVLWQHGKDPTRGSVPVARTESLVYNEAQDKWIARIVWEEDAFSQMIRTQVRNGTLSAASVTVAPQEVERRTVNKTTVPVFTRSVLLEWSIVAVPGNAGALVEEREISPLTLPSGETLQEVIGRVDATLREIQERLGAPPDPSGSPEPTGSLPASEPTGSTPADPEPAEPPTGAEGTTDAGVSRSDLPFLSPEQSALVVATIRRRLEEQIDHALGSRLGQRG